MTADKQLKVIKRYANRKLYDTERSCYVTLEEISQMIKEGEEVQVVDNKTKDDLTAVTLAQIIVEEEKKVSRMPLKLLRSIIQSGNEALGDFYQKRVMDPVHSFRDDVERRVEGLFKRDEKGRSDEEEAGDRKAGEEESGVDERGSNVVKEFVTSTHEAFENWQRRIDERVKEALSRMTHLSHVGGDVVALKERIQEVEARLLEVEGKDRPEA
jgi:polyhydroxyalkanoate synthesis repressor PhaR